MISPVLRVSASELSVTTIELFVRLDSDDEDEALAQPRDDAVTVYLS